MRRRSRFVIAVFLALAGMTCGTVRASGETMTKSEIIDKIEASGLDAEINSVLGLELGRPSDFVGDEYLIEPEASEPFAMDGSGGTFNLLSDGRILLIDSEGGFGVVASDFDEFVAMGTGLPGWRDALKFAGEPDLAKARAAWAAYAQKWGLDNGMDAPWPFAGVQNYSVATPRAARQAIRARLGVEIAADPFAMLHRAVNELNGDVRVSWQGEPLLPFGRRP